MNLDKQSLKHSQRPQIIHNYEKYRNTLVQVLNICKSRELDNTCICWKGFFLLCLVPVKLVSNIWTEQADKVKME